jgi:hypothetical protein
MEFIGHIFGLLGFGLKWTAELIVANFAGFASALAGTFVGAYSAFQLEQRQRLADAEDRRVGAANRALYTLKNMWNVLRQYQREHLDGQRDQPDLWLNLAATPPFGQSQGLVQFEAGELTFLLSRTHGNIFDKMLLQEQRFKVTLGLVDRRTALVFSEVFPRMERAQVHVGDQRPIAEIEAILGISLVHQLKQLTPGIVQFVDEDVAALRALFGELRAALVSLYPHQEFINVDFNPPQT